MTEIAAAMGLTNLEEVEPLRRAESPQLSRLSQRDRLGFPACIFWPTTSARRTITSTSSSRSSPGFPVTRDRLVEVLHAENILARKYFWPGCHNMEPYRSLYPHAGLVLPNTQAVAERVVVLPTGVSIDETHVRQVTDVLRVAAQR